MRADRRQIFAILLNQYLEGLSIRSTEGETGPFYDTDIEAVLRERADGVSLVLVCKHFRLAFAATAKGMLEARGAIDDLAQLAAGSFVGLGEVLSLDGDRGYYIEDDKGRRYLGESSSDERRLWDEEEGADHG